jgi:hypothetical protein
MDGFGGRDLVHEERDHSETRITGGKGLVSGLIKPDDLTPFDQYMLPLVIRHPAGKV